MFPIRDVNPSLTRPWITWAIIALAAYVFFFAQPRQEPAAVEFTYRYAAIPCEVTTAEPLTAGEITSMRCSSRPDDGGRVVFPEKSIPASLGISIFLHAGLLHLLGNMWSLWIFGNNVEDAYGKAGYMALYAVSGLVASLGHILLRPDSTIPLVGASGAIAGVMGAYLVLFPRSEVVTLIPILFLPWVVAVPAILFLGIWFVAQFLLAGQLTNIAWEAHVAGFLVGIVVTFLLQVPLRRRIQAHRARLIRVARL